MRLGDRRAPKKADAMKTERRRGETTNLRKRDRTSKLAKRRQHGGDDSVTPEQAATEATSALAVLAAPPDAAAFFDALQRLRRSLSHPTEPPTTVVVESGVVPRLVELLADFSNDQVQLEVLWCLTNISADHTEVAQAALCALPHLMALLASGNPALQEQAGWVVGNLAAEEDEFRAAVVAAGALPAVANLLRVDHGPNVAILRTAAWAWFAL